MKNFVNIIEKIILIAVAFLLGYGSCYYSQRYVIKELLKKETIRIEQKIDKLKIKNSRDIDIDLQSRDTVPVKRKRLKFLKRE